MTEIPAAEYRVSEKDGAEYITVKVPSEYRATLDWELSLLKTGQVYCKFGKPKKPRTTGAGSQSAHFHGHCMSIAIGTGNSFDDVKMALKIIAMDEGYPGKVVGTVKIPQSEADASTSDEHILIEVAHRVAAEEGIKLIETEPEIKAMPEGHYRDKVEKIAEVFGGEIVANTLNPEPVLSVKAWHKMTDAEKRESDPHRFDDEKQLPIF